MEQRVPQDTRSHSIRLATFEEYQEAVIVLPTESMRELYARIGVEHDGPCETTGLLSLILDSIMESKDHHPAPLTYLLGHRVHSPSLDLRSIYQQ